MKFKILKRNINNSLRFIISTTPIHQHTCICRFFVFSTYYIPNKLLLIICICISILHTQKLKPKYLSNGIKIVENTNENQFYLSHFIKS